MNYLLVFMLTNIHVNCVLFNDDLKKANKKVAFAEFEPEYFAERYNNFEILYYLKLI